MRECEIIIEKALESGRSSLLLNEAQRISNLHQIPTPKSALAANIDEAVEKADQVGFPIVLKIVSPKILHKSDLGGVVLNINDKKELMDQYEKLIDRIHRNEPSVDITGVLVEKMMPPSNEVIVGGLRDAQFGATIMFGIGGIFAEVYDDVAFRVAPIDGIDAENLVNELRGSRILKGFRGRPAADLDSIIRLLIKVSDLLMMHDDIYQLDLNPVAVYSDSVCAVDSRIIIGRKEDV